MIWLLLASPVSFLSTNIELMLQHHGMALTFVS